MINISLFAFFCIIFQNRTQQFGDLSCFSGLDRNFAAILFFAGLGKIFDWKSSLIGALIMCAGFRKYFFLGIPLIKAMYGEEGLKTVMLVDQPGFVALSTVGILVANFYSGSKDSLLKHLSKILKFPPFIAFVIALLLNVFSIEIPKDFDEVFNEIGRNYCSTRFGFWEVKCNGKKLRKKGFHFFHRFTFQARSFAFIDFGDLQIYFPSKWRRHRHLYFRKAMAPMITAAIIASAHDLEPKFCNLMVAVGIPLSILTVGIWHLLLPFL